MRAPLPQPWRYTAMVALVFFTAIVVAEPVDTVAAAVSTRPVALGVVPSPPHVYAMRKFPYPFLAMLAISSDADHETLRKFNVIHEFLNTTDITPMGKGLGLDVADSMFMYNGSNIPGPIDVGHTPLTKELTYFQGVSAKPAQAAILNRYMHQGWIDTLHSFGDFSLVNPNRTRFRKGLAVRAIQTLRANHDFLTVWTDHGNPSNVDDFGAYGGARNYWYQRGANPWSNDNIANLLVSYGVRFVWTDIASDQFGYYSIIYPKRLPDGVNVWGFWRYTNNGFDTEGDPEWVWTADDLDKELTIQNLLHIEYFHQYAIVAQHLSANNARLPLSQNTIESLRLLASQYRDGHILVARTSRLLAYNVAQKYIRYRVRVFHGQAIVNILTIADPVFGRHKPLLSAVRGITFYTSNPRRTTIEIDGVAVPASLIQYNPSDGVHASVGIRWFPADTTNYVRVAAPRPLAVKRRHHGLIRRLWGDLVGWLGL